MAYYDSTEHLGTANKLGEMLKQLGYFHVSGIFFCVQLQPDPEKAISASEVFPLT